MSDIVVSDLIKVYKTGKLEVIALRGLDATFLDGKVTLVHGPSGCGKTTLLNLIGGLDRPTAGSIRVDRVNLPDLSDKELVTFRRDAVGFVFQFFNLIPVLTAEENVDLPMRLAGTSAKERTERTASLLEAVGLSGRARQKPDELSGGEQQRVALAVALANDPTIILADEPTGNLDTQTALKVIELLLRVNARTGQTVVMVTHDPNVGKRSHRILRMDSGLMVTEEIGELAAAARAT